MKSVLSQEAVCEEFGSPYVPPDTDSKVGIALSTLSLLPLNAIRHPAENGTCGWYIWGGTEQSQAPDFFQPLHIHHLMQHCPAIIPYLGLAPGWGVVLAPNYKDVWYDSSFLDV